MDRATPTISTAMGTNSNKSNSIDPVPRKKARIEEQVDQICNLPDVIIQHILSFLPTLDAMRASFVGKRWRSLCTETRILNFDDRQFLQGKEAVTDSVDFSVNQSAHPKLAFADFVTSMHLMYRAAKIERYHLSIRHATNLKYVQAWISVADQMNVKELSVDMIKDGPFEMPCCRSVKDLRLHLGNGSLNLPSTGYFSSLKTLSLSKISSINDTVLDVICQRSPQLRSLKLEDCFVTEQLQFNYPLLEELEIRRCYGLNQLSVSAEKLQSLCVYSSFTYGSSSVTILAPTLQTFKWLNNIIGEFSMGDFISLSTAHVTLVMQYDLEERVKYLTNAKNFLNLLQHVESLQVEMVCFWGLSVMKDTFEALSGSMQNLKHLRLWMVSDNQLFRGISSLLLNCCSNLETLQMDIHEGALDRSTMAISEDDEHWIYQKPQLDRLWKVKFRGFGGKDHEMEFVEFLFKNAIHLRRMVILLKSSLDKSMQTEITLKLMKLGNSSPNVSMSFQ